MVSFFWNGLGKTEKNKDIINIFFATDSLSRAAGILLGLEAYLGTLGTTSTRRISGSCVVKSWIAIHQHCCDDRSYAGFVFLPIGERDGLGGQRRPRMPLCGVIMLTIRRVGYLIRGAVTSTPELMFRLGFAEKGLPLLLLSNRCAAAPRSKSFLRAPSG